MFIGLVGDSISTSVFGVPQNAEARTTFWRPGEITYSNASVGGTFTADWMQGTLLFNGATLAFDALSRGFPQDGKYISIMLGANDSASVDQATYQARLQDQVDGWVGQGYKVILHYPPPLDPAGSVYLPGPPSRNDRILSYQTAIRNIADGVNVFVGGTRHHDIILASPATYMEAPEGIHPNALGSLVIGYSWADAINLILQPYG